MALHQRRVLMCPWCGDSWCGSHWVLFFPSCWLDPQGSPFSFGDFLAVAVAFFLFWPGLLGAFSFFFLPFSTSTFSSSCPLPASSLPPFIFNGFFFFFGVFFWTRPPGDLCGHLTLCPWSTCYLLLSSISFPDSLLGRRKARGLPPALSPGRAAKTNGQDAHASLLRQAPLQRRAPLLEASRVMCTLTPLSLLLCSGYQEIGFHPFPFSLGLALCTLLVLGGLHFGACSAAR